MKILGKTIFTALFSLAMNLAHASGLDTLHKFNSDTDGISGQFTQTVKSKKRTQVTSGTFAIQRPGLFRWEYVKPYKQTIVGDGKTVWLYDQDLAQVTKRPQNQTIGDSPAAILSNKSALNANYSLADDGQKDGINYIQAKPKRSNTGYQNIRIGFRGDNLANMQLKDSFGNLTTITFTQINTQPKFDRSIFKFTPPKGVDVLTQ